MSKKAFRIVASVLVLLVAFSAFLLTACKRKPEEVTTALQSISLDLTNVKAEYYIGEDFSANGLAVKAKYQKSDGSAPYEEALSATDYTVDSSKFNKAAAGEYEIKVSYTYEGTTKSVVFKVSVKPVSYDGLEVTLAQDVADTYHLSAEATTVEIDTAKIVVKETDVDGNVIDAAISGYTVELYRGKDKVELAEGKASVGEGAYQIWVSKASDKVANYTRTCFVTIYVLDDVKTLAWDNTAEGTVATQEEGDDLITETLKFVVTYESGKTKVVGADKVTMDKLDTKTVGEDKTVSATYTEANAKSEKKTTSAATVTYTVTAKPEEGPKPVEVFVNANDLTAGSITEKVELASGISIIATSSKNVTVDGNAKEIDGISFTQRIKLNGTGKKTERCFEIVTTGAATIYVYTQSGSSADRDLGLFNESGTELAAQTALGASITKLTFEVDAAGTYYIWSKNSGINVYGIKVITTPAAEATAPDVIFGTSETLTAALLDNKGLGSDTVWVSTDNVTITILKNCKCKATTNELTVGEQSVAASAGVNTAGGLKTTEKSIKVELGAKAKITVYYVAAGTSERKLVISNGTSNILEGEACKDDTTTVKTVVTDELDAGTYYIGANTGGMTVLCIVIEYC